jgi:hypothetical protein
MRINVSACMAAWMEKLSLHAFILYIITKRQALLHSNIAGCILASHPFFFFARFQGTLNLT